MSELLAIDRLPPQALDAERGVLGSVLLWNDALDELADLISADGREFYLDAHRRIWLAIRALRQEGSPADALTVAERLEATEMLDEIGGAAYLVELLDSVPHAAHAAYYARSVAEAAARRGLISAASTAISRAYDGTIAVDDLLSGAESSVHELIEGRLHGQESTELTQILFEVFEKLDGGAPGLAIGFPDLQAKLKGWFPGNLIVIAARPGMGKSAFAVNLARLAGQFGTGVYFASLEMTRLELAERLLSLESGIASNRIRSGELTADERSTLLSAASMLQTLPIWIDDKSPRTMAQISAAARLKIRQTEATAMPCRLVVVDYLQIVAAENRRDHREQQVSQISRDLKALAKSLNVTVIALAQLNRQVEQRVNKRPQLSDLRESGAIEQDADAVLFLDRPAEYDATAHPNLSTVIVAKHRGGETGDVKLVWQPATMEFLSAAPDWMTEFSNHDPSGLGGEV